MTRSPRLVFLLVGLVLLSLTACGGVATAPALTPTQPDLLQAGADATPAAEASTIPTTDTVNP